MPSFEHIKPFTSGAQTVYSVLPHSLTWSPRSARLHRMQASVVSRYLAPAQCWFCGQTNKPRVQASVVSRYLAPAPCTRHRLALLAPCEPHLIPSSTGSLEPSLLVSPSPEATQAQDLSRLFFTCNNANQAASNTCNTRPRVSPHNIVNHSS